MATLKLHNTFISFGKRELLQNASFTLSTGKIIGLIGGNGSGKSTLLKAIFGTVKIDSISISIDGESFLPWTAISSKQIGYLPQHSFIPRYLKVRDLIPIYFPKEAEQDRIFYDPLIATFTSKNIQDLSFGQRRYLEVLLIIHLDRNFLLLDEPFSTIEPRYKEQLKNYIKQLSSEKGILITDHYYDDVVEIAHQNYLIKNKQLNHIASKQNLNELKDVSDEDL